MRKLIAAVLALCLAFSLTACAGGGDETTAAPSSAAETTQAAEDTTEAAEATEAAESTEAAAEVMTYEEYMAAQVDDLVTIQAYVQAKQSYYAEQGTATVYLQDEDGGRKGGDIPPRPVGKGTGFVPRNSPRRSISYFAAPGK